MTRILFFMLLAGSILAQSDFKIDLKLADNAFQEETTPFPEGLELFALDMKAKSVQLGEMTLVQVWSACCGAEPEIWGEVEAMVREYEEHGLTWVSVNFENGLNMGQMKSKMNDYFAQREAPKNLYLDPMGDIIDQLKVTGFPTYLLVVGDTVVFRTNGKDPEGVRLFRQQIEKRIL